VAGRAGVGEPCTDEPEIPTRPPSTESKAPLHHRSPDYPCTRASDHCSHHERFLLPAWRWGLGRRSGKLGNRQRRLSL
jgi:hypothetical protein